MKRYIKHLIILAITIASVVPSAFAQVDVTRSFYVLRNDSTANAFVEGGEWLIEFSNRDTLGYEYDHPVAMNFKGAYYPDSTFIPMQAVDSVQFVQPSTIMKPGVFELTEEHYKYIVDTDMFNVIRFRIDCIAKIDLPKVGQKVISLIQKDPLPLGFIGQVESIKVNYDEGCIVMTCKRIKLSEVYSRLYIAQVLGGEEEIDTLGQNAPNGNALKPLDYDYNDINESYPIFKTVLPDIGLSYNVSKRDFDVTLKPKTAHSPFVGYIVDQVFAVTVTNHVVIDENDNKDYTELYGTISYTSTVGARIDALDGQIPKLTKKYSFAPENILAPKQSNGQIGHGWCKPIEGVPGLFFFFDAGVMASAEMNAQFSVEGKADISFSIGAKIQGSIVSPIFKGLDKNTKALTFPASFTPTVGASLGVTAKTGFYLDVILGVAMDLASVSAEFFLGPRFTYNMGMKSADIISDLSPTRSWFAKTKDALSKYNKNNMSKLDGGFDYDGNVKLLQGVVFEGSWVKFLEKWGIPHFDLMYDFWAVDGIPNYTYTEDLNSKDAYSGRLTRDKGFLCGHDLGLIFKDSYFSDETPEYILKYDIGRQTTTFKNGKYDIPFTINSDETKILKGKPLDVYTYMYNDEDGYFSTGKISHIEFPYESKVTQTIGDDYTYVEVDVEVDPDAADDEEYTQCGLLVWNPDIHEEDEATNIIGNENYAANFSLQIDRKTYEHGNTLGDLNLRLKPWVYDSKRDRYIYGTLTPYKFKSMSTPVTEKPTDITYNSVYLNGKISEYLVASGLEYKVGFRYHIPGESGTTVDLEYDSKEISDISITNKFKTLVVGLRPNTEYECMALVRVNNSTLFCGDPVKFKTKNVISNLRHDAGSDFAILYADLPTDYIAENCKNIYFEVVEENKDFSSAISKLVDEGDFVINDDGTTTIDVIFYDLVPSLSYKYRVLFVDDDDNKIYSNTGTFSTDATALKAITKGASVKGNVAVLKGNLSLDLVRLLESQGIKKVYFGYSKFSDMRNKVVVNADFVGTYSTVTLSDLTYGSTYYYYFYAVDADNDVYEGEVQYFVTDASPINTPETCFTLEADVTDANVTMLGGVPQLMLPSINTGFYRNVQYGFEVAEKQSDLTGNTPTFATDEIDKETGIFTITKILQPNTRYYIRAMVFINDRWIVAPEVVSVKTADFDPNLKPPDVPKK